MVPLTRDDFFCIVCNGGVDLVYFGTTDEGHVRFICRTCEREMMRFEQTFEKVEPKHDWKKEGF